MLQKILFSCFDPILKYFAKRNIYILSILCQHTSIIFTEVNIYLYFLYILWSLPCLKHARLSHSVKEHNLLFHLYKTEACGSYQNLLLFLGILYIMAFNNSYLTYKCAYICVNTLFIYLFVCYIHNDFSIVQVSKLAMLNLHH